MLPYAKRILFLQGRLRFHTPDGLPGKDVANAPSALIAYTIDDALALKTSLTASQFLLQSLRELVYTITS